MGRIYAWTTSWNIGTDRVLGGGFEYPLNPDVITKYSPSGQRLVAHSIYFQVLGEHGFTGLGLYLLFWALVWKECATLRRQTRGDPELRWADSVASSVQASLVGFAVGGAFLNLAYWDMPYYLYAAVVVARYAVVAQAKRTVTSHLPESAPPTSGMVVGPAQHGTQGTLELPKSSSNA